MSKTITHVKENELHLQHLIRNQTSIVDSTINILKQDHKAVKRKFDIIDQQKTSGNKAELIIRLKEIPEERRGNFQNSAVDADATQDDNGDKGQASGINEGASSADIVNKCGVILPKNDDANNQTSAATKEKESHAIASDEKESDANEWRLLKYELELLKRECELQKRENEMLKKEKDQLRNGGDQDKNISNKQKLADVKELISEFSGSGECFKLWQTQLQNIQSAYNLDDNNMRALIAKKASKLMLKRKLEARRWLISESFEEYFHAKLILANKILIGEDELVEYLVEGIPDHGLRSQAKMQRFRDKYELLEAFRTIQLPKFLSRKITADTQREQPNSEQQVARASRCYNCNSVGHLANECRKSKRELCACHVCAVVGHYAANCPQRKIRPVHYVSDLMEDDEFVH
ncbi:uncharacterized protein LOC118751744 [Rhagoletis pomonella]|uniref:uncharacterized protein LOC118751744 n=1 Tax=Rhagoletis pomonella TaxID=28610 RepID=UPI00177BF18A|nr:uncharacterized protein LOC118751744 [Rhagoletis pomonella]